MGVRAICHQHEALVRDGERLTERLEMILALDSPLRRDKDELRAAHGSPEVREAQLEAIERRAFDAVNIEKANLALSPRLEIEMLAAKRE